PVVRSRSKISMDNLLAFDLTGPRGHGYVIIRYDETTRGVQAKARAEVSIYAEASPKLSRDTEPYRGNRNDDLAKILSVFHGGRRACLGRCRGRQTRIHSQNRNDLARNHQTSRRLSTSPF